MRYWPLGFHFVGNEKLGLSERSSDVPISFTRDLLPHFYTLVSIECGCPNERSIERANEGANERANEGVRERSSE